MKYKMLAAVTALTAAVAVASPLYAWGGKSGKGGPGGHGMFMEQLDTNKDGKISAEEFEAKGEGRFTDIDADGNNSVTMDEFKAYIEKKREERLNRMFSALDTDGSGTVSEEEFAKHRETKFSRMDKNGDGILEKDEMPFGKHGPCAAPGAPEAPGAEE